MEAIIIIASGALFIAGGFFYWRNTRLTRELRAKEEETKRRMYELSILKEVGDRIGYSLNVEKIADVITGSLNQFIEYSLASYMLLEPERIVFKADLERPVSRKFVDDVKGRMLNALSVLLNKDLSKDPVEEIITGALVHDDEREPVRSFFNIPLVIGERVEGVLTIAHIKAGLYREDEMTLLYKIVAQASHAVMKLQEVVRTEEAKLNAMVESMAEGVVMTDNDFRIAVANPAAKEVIGYPPARAVSIFDFIDNLEGKFDIKGKLEESVKLEKVLAQDSVLLRDRYYQILIAPVRQAASGKSNILGGVVIFHDVTKEKLAEKMRQDFTSMMVHELRSPLDGVKKMGELMQSDVSIRMNENAFREYMGMIHKSASSMLDLVNDLLDVAKIESGKFEIRKKFHSIIEVVKDRIRFFDTAARDAKIELAFASTPKVPPMTDFDPVRIAQVLGNLIANAIKFTNAGGKITVAVFFHEKGSAFAEEARAAGTEWFVADEPEHRTYPSCVVVSVTDTGIGISEENVKKLFNKFEQFAVSMRSGEKKGTGLGLVIVKGILDTHGERVLVGSKEEVGSTFAFTLKTEP